MRFISGLSLCVLVSVLSTCNSVSKVGLLPQQQRQFIPDPATVTSDEAYLLPFEKELVDFRTNAIAKEYIALADLVDAVPTFIWDILIPLFIPGSTITIPLNKTIPLLDANSQVPLPTSITLVNITLSDLDEFKKLRPAQFLKGGLYTWGGVIELDNLAMIINAKLTVLGHDIDAGISLSLAKPSIDFAAIFAYQRSRLCDVWGAIMRSSRNCAVWPFFMEEAKGISGVNITQLGISVTDFNFTINVTGLGNALDTEVAQELDSLLAKAKPNIIANLNSTISDNLRQSANKGLLLAISLTQIAAPCHPRSVNPTMNVSYIINVSEVCIVNNGGYDLKWSFQDCPANTSSAETSAYPIDEKKCMDVGSTVPNIQVGDTVRINTHAVAGLREISDPIFHYAPNSNGAAFECSGSTLLHKCTLISLAPVNPSIPPPASTVCIINQAGFVMGFKATDSRTGAETTDSGHYPIDQKRCIALTSAAGTKEGDLFSVDIHAEAGKSNKANRVVEYQDNGLTTTFQCHGTTLDYSCDLVL